MKIELPNTWRTFLGDSIEHAAYQNLMEKVCAEYDEHPVYPHQHLIFNALNLCPAEATKVVILGQDPYHNPGQAQGLAFSVPKHTPLPPSLRNIYQEIKDDTGTSSVTEGDLTDWATQGVLLLNTTLTVRANTPLSHATLGWELLTNAILTSLSQYQSNIVYLLWGKHAQAKAGSINPESNHILTAAHPSPLSAYRGFFGCKHFSTTNEYLQNHGKSPIRW